MQTTIPIADRDALRALQSFLKSLLEKGAVEAIMVPMRERSGAVMPALVTRPEHLDSADPLAPVMSMNSARQVSALSIREPRGRIGVVLRSCEIRALIELVKLQQASLDDLLIVGIECGGTYSLTDYVERMKADPAAEPWRELYADPLTDRPLRDACQMCEHPLPLNAAITIRLLGADLVDAIPITVPDELGEKLGLAPIAPIQRGDVVEALVAKRTATRDAIFAEIREQLADADGLTEFFATCIRCHNCMVNCPVCYCKTCLFRTPAFDHEPAQYMTWAMRKGAARLPSDTLLFHMTRLNHMSTSCVGCGMCTEACPSGISVGRVFRAVGEKTQAIFEYQPGRSVEDPLPVTTFREDELADTAVR
jgi:formate dehydrogenase subunit beta